MLRGFGPAQDSTFIPVCQRRQGTQVPQANAANLHFPLEAPAPGSYHESKEQLLLPGAPAGMALPSFPRIPTSGALSHAGPEPTRLIHNRPGSENPQSGSLKSNHPPDLLLPGVIRKVPEPYCRKYSTRPAVLQTHPCRGSGAAGTGAGLPGLSSSSVIAWEVWLPQAMSPKPQRLLGASSRTTGREKRARQWRLLDRTTRIKDWCAGVLCKRDYSPWSGLPQLCPGSLDILYWIITVVSLSHLCFLKNT